MAVKEVTPEDLLKFLSDRGSLDSYGYAQETGSEHQAVVGAIKSLESLGDVCRYTSFSSSAEVPKRRAKQLRHC